MANEPSYTKWKVFLYNKTVDKSTVFVVYQSDSSLPTNYFVFLINLFHGIYAIPESKIAASAKIIHEFITDIQP